MVVVVVILLDVPSKENVAMDVSSHVGIDDITILVVSIIYKETYHLVKVDIALPVQVRIDQAKVAKNGKVI